MIEGLIDRAKSPDRVERLEAKLVGPDLPDGAEYLIEWFNDVGPSQYGGMGPVPLTYTEIHAWVALRRIEIDDWEARLLRELSVEFCIARSKAIEAEDNKPKQPS
jgi:hypothetical protein